LFLTENANSSAISMQAPLRLQICRDAAATTAVDSLSPGGSIAMYAVHNSGRDARLVPALGRRRPRMTGPEAAGAAPAGVHVQAGRLRQAPIGVKRAPARAPDPPLTRSTRALARPRHARRTASR